MDAWWWCLRRRGDVGDVSWFMVAAVLWRWADGGHGGDGGHGHALWWWSWVRRHCGFCGCGGVGCVVWQWADGGRVELVVVVPACHGEGVEGGCQQRNRLMF